MKKTALYLLLLTVGINAHCQYIDSIKYDPQNPTYNDTLTIICYVRYPTIDCPTQIKHYYYGNNSIILQSFHCCGNLTMICNTTDTFIVPLPKYQTGLYSIYYMPGYITDQNCNFPIDINGDTIPYPYAISSINVYVNEPSNIEISDISYYFSIFPNPFHNKLNIMNNSSTDNYTNIKISNLLGVVLFCNIYYHSNEKIIDLSNLPNGIFLLKISTPTSNFVRKIIKE